MNDTPLTCDDLLKILRDHHLLLEGYNVSKIGVFGSVARGDSTEKSDIDLLVAFKATPDLFAFMELQEKLEALLGRRVDLATEDMLHETMRSTILAEAIYA